MMRNASHPCPTGCGRSRQRWMAVCPACWKRLPIDLAQRLIQARRDKIRHREAEAAIAATAWLRAHPAEELAGRIVGEAPG